MRQGIISRAEEVQQKLTSHVESLYKSANHKSNFVDTCVFHVVPFICRTRNGREGTMSGMAMQYRINGVHDLRCASIPNNRAFITCSLRKRQRSAPMRAAVTEERISKARKL